MNLFQVILVPTLFGCSVYCLWRSMAHRRRRFALAGLLLAIAGACIADPLLTQKVADLLGIGRGADLVSYLAALGVLGAYFLTLHTNRKLRLEITELTRQLALRDLQTTQRQDPEPLQPASSNQPHVS